MVVARSQDAQVVARSDGAAVQRGGVAKGSSIACDGGLLEVVAGLTTHDETLVGDGDIGGGIDVAGGWVVGEEAADVGGALLEVEGELVRLRAVLGGEGAQELGFETVGEGVLELDLGVDDVGRGEGLGDGDPWRRGATLACVL